jgi:hypothetical protein
MHFKSGVKKKANRKYQGEVTFARFCDTRHVPSAKLFAQLCAQTNVMIFDVIPLNKYCLSINYDRKSSKSCLFLSNYCESLPIFAESELLVEKNHPRQAYYHFVLPSSRFKTRYAKMCFTSQKHDYLVIEHVTSYLIFKMSASIFIRT